jgi:hypothetical protein
MRVGIVYYSEKNKKFGELVKEMEKALTERGFQVQIVDLKTSKASISAFNFVMIGCDTISLFGGKLSDIMKNNVKQTLGITGKHCSVFSDGKFGSFKTLSNLMRLLEQQGLMIFSSSCLQSPAYAYKFAKEITVE